MTDKAAIPDAWRPFGKPRGTRDPELNLDARAQAFLDRIAPDGWSVTPLHPASGSRQVRRLVPADRLL